MELNEDARIDTSQVEDRRGSSGGGMAGLPISGRGGLIGLVITVLVALAGGGFGISQLTGDGGDQGDNTALEQRCAADDALRHLDCRNNLFINSIQTYWQRALPEHFDRPYQQSDTVFFEQAVSSGCGQADSGVGPFYCPLDDKVYIDLSFYKVLAEQLGAPGEFAQPYVLAHEYGHHVQDLLGTEARVREQREQSPDDANQLSVLLELQADCYAGAWAKNATGTADDRGVKIFKSLSGQDIQEGLDTAAAIGDDAIQRKSGGRIDESQFTHGSSADRQKWFNTGYQNGNPTACDTFKAAG
ncbi:neutral zinc metallopeptidase [Plantactinospora sp. S1510]|uniref:Neutral zinc metallopeptidase n=1 Tax=Plantactinospora alkalitolerans TaxID=2789879 RepID=A0ABS0GXQ9_9ACTN|nr:neutral zinc metallopeptidase [Plantactinospora alkalitolerans]MBF9130972.1 neutral zinc metallopeptidase [Plantactinospora alkalitolerans]